MYLKRILILSLIVLMGVPYPLGYTGFGVPGSQYLLEEINREVAVYTSTLDPLLDETLSECTEIYQEFRNRKEENVDVEEFTESITQVAEDVTVDLTDLREHLDDALKEMQVDLNDLAGYPVKNPTLQQIFISEIMQSLKSRRKKILKVQGCFQQAKHIVTPPLNISVPPQVQEFMPESAIVILNRAEKALSSNSINWVAYSEAVSRDYRPPVRPSF